MKIIDDVEVTIENGELEIEEVKEYIQYIKDKNKEETLTQLTLTVDGEFVDMSYTLRPQPIDRIRRITGYLVGTLDRFNDAKSAEEQDRVKHM